MHRGYIKLHRRLNSHWLFEEGRPRTKYEAWLDLLQLASQTTTRRIVRGQVIVIESGELIGSLRFFAARWMWSKKAVECFISLLEKDQMITRRTGHRETVVTICNYATYQVAGTTQGDTQGDSKRDTQGTLRGHSGDKNKNDKNDKKEYPHAPEGEQRGSEELFPLEKSILPKDWKKLSKTEQGRKKVNHNDPLMIRIGKFLGQRETTLWTISEYLALQDVNPSEDDLDLIGQHYSLVIENNGYRFKDLLTLLNNWPKARTRAEAYFQEFPDHRGA